MLNADNVDTFRFSEIGKIIQRDRFVITDAWMEEAARHQPDADPQRRREMYDDLPGFLEKLGEQLGRRGALATPEPSELAARHGRERWRVGWSLYEVVRDYQIMRMTIIEHLSLKLDPYITAVEAMALHSALDEAINESVNAYVAEVRQVQHDLTQNLEEKVIERTYQIQQLSRELLQAEQRERHRLAGMLHDELQQHLFAAKMQVHNLGRRLQDEDLATEARRVEATLSESIETARVISVELSPPILEERGLAAALHWLKEWVGERFELEVEVEADPKANPASDEVSLFGLQAARELLLNVVKHAGSQAAYVRLAVHDDALAKLTVRDEGTGLQNMSESANGLTLGTGLTRIQQRARLLGGNFEVRNASGGGVEATLMLPRMKPAPAR